MTCEYLTIKGIDSQKDDRNPKNKQISQEFFCEIKTSTLDEIRRLNVDKVKFEKNLQTFMSIEDPTHSVTCAICFTKGDQVKNSTKLNKDYMTEQVLTDWKEKMCVD